MAENSFAARIKAVALGILLGLAQPALGNSSDAVDPEVVKAIQAAVDGLNAGDARPFNALNDGKYLAARLLDPLELDREMDDALRAQMSAAMSQVGNQIVPSLAENGVHLVRIERRGETHIALVRMYFGRMEATFINYQIERAPGGGFRIVDSFDHRKGTQVIRDLRNVLAVMLATESNNDKTLKEFVRQRKDMNTMVRLVTAAKGGDLSVMKSLYSDLSKETRSDPGVLAALHSQADKSGNPDAALWTMEKIATLHPDDSRFRLLLSDYYWLKDDNARSDQYLARFASEENIDDSALLIQRGQLALRQNKPAVAIDFANRAIDLQRDFYDAWWLRLRAQATSNRYADAVVTAGIMSKEHGFYLTDEEISGWADYANWRESEEYLAWQASRATE